MMWKRNFFSPNNQTLFRSQNLLTKTRFETFADQKSEVILARVLKLQTTLHSANSEFRSA